MDIDIVQSSYTAELASAIPNQRTLWLAQLPIISVSAVRFGGVVVDSSEYTVREDQGGILAMEDDLVGSWGAGAFAYSVDYSAGYATIPSDLSLAATKQVRHEFRQTAEGGDRLGSENKALESGGSISWASAGWLDEVVQVMERYRRRS